MFLISSEARAREEPFRRILDPVNADLKSKTFDIFLIKT